MQEKKNILGNVAISKTRDLRVLIEELQNTTIGSLNEDIQALGKKIDSILLVLGVTLDASNQVLSNGYASHTHEYVDATINDTVDATGIQTDTAKTTQGVN